MADTVTVFGGTGFLGRAIVARLLEADATVRIAARRPGTVQIAAADERLEFRRADVRDAASVAKAVAGAGSVVNAVGLYRENRQVTFSAVHLDGAGIVAEQASRAGVRTLVHVSGIGADAASPWAYVRARARGELAASAAFGGTVIVRPSVLFGPGDAFLSAIDAIARIAPAVPLFGNGETRLQPVYVVDVAEAVRRLLASTPGSRMFELGGPDVLRYREIVNAVLTYRRRKRFLLPVPYSVWSALARVLRPLPDAPISGDQVILIRNDNVAGDGVPTFADLGHHPRRLGALLPVCLPPRPGRGRRQRR